MDKLEHARLFAIRNNPKVGRVFKAGNLTVIKRFDHEKKVVLDFYQGAHEEFFVQLDQESLGQVLAEYITSSIHKEPNQ